MAFLAKYFKQEAVGNVRADVNLVIRRLDQNLKDHQDAAPAAADETADGALQLDCFPAHNFILDNSEYFMVQQVGCGASM